MENCILILMFLFEFYLLRILFKNFGLSLVPTLSVAYLLLSQISFFLTYVGFLDFPDYLLSFIGSLDVSFFHANVVYFFLTLCVVAPYHDQISVKRESEFPGSKKFIITDHSILLTNEIFSYIYIFYIVLMIVFFRWDLVWSNNTYMLMASPDEILVSKFGPLVLIVVLMQVAGVATAALCAISLTKNFRGWVAFYGLLSIFFSIYSLGGHSRSAVLEPAVFVATLSALNEKRYRLVSLACVVYAVFAFWSALIGRNLPHQGLSSIFDLSGIFDSLSSLNQLGDGNSNGSLFKIVISVLFMNLTQGIFIISAGFDSHPVFPTLYKVLAFSPLPSFIDGYNKVKDVYQFSINPFTPVAGISEVLYFGDFYIILMFIIYFYSVRLCRAAERISHLAILGNFLIFESLIALCAYPIRSAFKGMWVADAFSLVILFMDARRRRRINA